MSASTKTTGQPTGQGWFLVTLGLSCATILALIFSVWELIEHRYFRDVDYVQLHYLYITRGVVSSLIVGLWATWFVWRERRRHIHELEQSHELYRSILDTAPEAVVLFDESACVIEWNRGAERLYGLTRSQVLGQTLPTLPGEKSAELQEILEALKHEQPILDYETQRCNAQGEKIPVAVSYALMPRRPDQPQLFLEVAQDIRPRLRLRDKLMEVEKLALMGQMAAGTAHHLNTPLTAMLLQVEMLRQERKTTDDGAELASIEQRIRFCQVFVQNLLRFARRSQLKKRAVRLCDVIESMVPLFQPNLRLKQVTLRVELDGLNHCHVLGDSAHLEALFSALVSNAVAAMPAGGNIRLHGEVENGHVGRIYIDDDGVGIPEQLLPRVYEPFFTTKPAGQGTGLGLAIARNIVAEHAGALQLENRPSGGVRATVKLPLLEENATVASSSSEKRP